MIKASGITAQYVSTEMILEDKKTREELFKALRWALNKCNGIINKKSRLLEIDKFVQYRRYDTEFAKSYTPAVVAEARYFKQLGINSKLGPTSELGFDNIIRESMRNDKLSYNLFWYSRPFEGKNGIFMNDSKNVFVEKLNSNPDYAKWVDDVISQFSEKKGLEGILEIRERIRKNME